MGKIQRFLSQPNFVAEAFTGLPGRYVKIEDTLYGFEQIIDGNCDDMPEQAFFMVGTLDEARDKARSFEGEEVEEPQKALKKSEAVAT